MCKILLECFEWSITVFLNISFGLSPKILNEIEFTMEFQEKDAHVTCSFNSLLDK